MASKRFHVVRYDKQAVTLKRTGLHLLKSETVITRASITSVGTRHGVVTVATNSGQRFEVLPGIRKEQRDLTGAAFGMAL